MKIDFQPSGGKLDRVIDWYFSHQMFIFFYPKFRSDSIADSEMFQLPLVISNWFKSLRMLLSESKKQTNENPTKCPRISAFLVFMWHTSMNGGKIRVKTSRN